MSAPPTGVADRLERLAAHAPAGTVDPDQLWSRGRRRQVLRAATGVATLAFVALAGVVTTAPLVERAQHVAPASSSGAMVLPDVIQEPAGWAPAFAGTPGRLSAVGLGARRTMWSSHASWWGVSAADGSTRFLDLPDAVADDIEAQPELSADGRWLAYWLAGEVDGESLRSIARPGLDDVVGVAVLDLTSGENRRWEIDTDNGMALGGLAWAGDTLWWSAGALEANREDGTSWTYRTHMWRTASDERVTLRVDDPANRWSLDEHGPAPDGFVTRGSGAGMWRVESDGSRTRTPLLTVGGKERRDLLHALTVNDRGDAVAALSSRSGIRDGSPQRVVAGPVDVSGARLAEGPSVFKVDDLIGWRSAAEVVAVRPDGPLYDGVQSRRLFTLDVARGRALAVVELRGTVPGSFATDALAGEIVKAPAAPFAPDPRLVGLSLFAAAVAVWLVARGVRRRRGHP